MSTESKVNEGSGITVGDLIDRLKIEDSDKPVIFGCEELKFFRVKNRGDVIQIEFNQSVYRGADGRVVVDDHK